MLIELDSDVLIAALSPHEAHSQTAQSLVAQIATGEHQAVVSSIAYGEVLALRLAHAAKELDLALFFASIKHITSVSADDLVCQMAGKLRRQHGLKLPDAIHLATALIHKAGLFITNDKSLARVAGAVLPTKTLSEWSSRS